jgi:hypothetical protein
MMQRRLKREGLDDAWQSGPACLVLWKGQGLRLEQCLIELFRGLRAISHDIGTPDTTEQQVQDASGILV